MQVTNEKDARGQRVLTLAGVVLAPIREVWATMSDTQRLRQVVFDLPAVEVLEASSASMKGRVETGGLALTFEELPWAYEAPHRYRSVRTFLEGPLERLEESCELEERGAETHVSLRITLGGKSGPVAWAAEKVLAHQVEKGLERLSALLESEAREPARLYKNPRRDDVKKRASTYVPGLEQVAPPALVQKLVDHLADAPDDEVARVRPYALAERWGAPRADVLALCLNAVKAGLLEMRWDVLCSSCRGPVHTASALGALPANARCAVCEVVSDVAQDSNVEAAFAPVSSVRAAKGDMYCLGSPSRTPHWLAQMVLDPDAVHVLQPTWGPGRYLVQSPGIAQKTLIDVGETGDDAARVTLEGERGGRAPTLPGATPVLRAGRIKLTLKNEDARARRVQIVHDDVADLAATAAHVTATPTWQRLFQTAG